MESVIYGEKTKRNLFDLGDRVVYSELVTSQYDENKVSVIKHTMRVLGIRYKGVGKHNGVVGYQYLLCFKYNSIQDLSAEGSFWVDEVRLETVNC